MAWTEITRAKYQRDGLRYASDTAEPQRFSMRMSRVPPEFIAPQDGAVKQDCERNAAKRWLARHSTTLAHLRPIYLGGDLFTCQLIVAAKGSLRL